MIKNLQSLRFVFIMLIVMSHFIGSTFGFGGEGGVAFFFILSGFILSYAYGEKVKNKEFQHKSFLRKQFWKFYPLHLLTFAIMIALDARLGHYFHWTKLLANMLLLQSWIPSNDYYFVANGSSWFLSDLIYFYVIFPFLFLFLMRASRRTLAVIGVIILLLYACLAASIPEDLINPLLYASPLTRQIDFAIGILLFRLCSSNIGDYLRKQMERMTPQQTTWLEMGMVVLVIIAFFIYENVTWRFCCASLFWFTMPPVLYVFYETDKRLGNITRLFHTSAMQWLGGISFEIYLTHWIVMRITKSIMLSCGIDIDNQLLMVILITTPVIIVVAWLTKRFFVQPIYSRMALS